MTESYNCKLCDQEFTTHTNLEKHFESNKHKTNQKINDLNKEINILNKKNNDLEIKNNKLINDNDKYKNNDEKINNMKVAIDEINDKINIFSSQMSNVDVKDLSNTLNNRLNNLDKDNSNLLEKVNSDFDKVYNAVNFISKFISYRTLIDVAIIGFLITSNYKRNN